MSHKEGRAAAFFHSRWLVFVASMWLQSCAGIGYLFGSLSPAIKSSMGYNQRQIASLGVAKDLGDSVGFLAGSLCEILPSWGVISIGAIQNIVGYGLVWLIVAHKAPPVPLWVVCEYHCAPPFVILNRLLMCILIFVGTNGETYFNTAALVSCVQNFPKNRGPVVGILKGFAGLSGAILTQVYALINAPDRAAMIFMVAVGPTMVGIGLMFMVRPVGGHRQACSSDGSSFTFLYSICLLLAAYLMGVMLLEDLVDLSKLVITIFTIVLFLLLLAPFAVPLYSTCLSHHESDMEESLLPSPHKGDSVKEAEFTNVNEVIFSEVEDEKPREVDLLPAQERKKRIAQLQARLFQAAADGAVRVKRKKGPRRGENFTLTQALIKADFWLIWFSLLLGSGSGLTVIDNLGQMSQSLGYDNTHIFVSMISIWNFLGRVGGGYISEVVVRDYAYPRHVALVVLQVVMAVGHFSIAMAWPGAMHIGTLLVGLGYGAHWAIVPASASELFGLKNFGALYNFLTLANPGGSLVLSGMIASTIYDCEAEKQAHGRHHPMGSPGISSWVHAGVFTVEDSLKCDGAVCFFLTSTIMSVLCIIAAILSMVLVYRTKIVYFNLYGKART